MRNVILTDCDGVLLNWEDAFLQWMVRNGYELHSCREFDNHGINIAHAFSIPDAEVGRFIKTFNESAEISELPPLRDAIKYVRTLHAEPRHVPHAIPPFSTGSPAADRLRRKNLKNLFGTAIGRLVCLPIRGDKADSLRPYGGQGIIFVEDRIQNADLAISLGIEGVLMEHDYNYHYNGAATQVKNWKEIYHYVVDGEEPSIYAERRQNAYEGGLRKLGQ